MSSSRIPQPNADVRMRGFHERSTVAAAVAWVDQQVAANKLRPRETVPLAAAAGRVLGGKVTSEVNVPGFDRAMMDGFAVRGEDTYGASPYNPLRLEIIGDCFPAQPFSRDIQRQQAVRIMTGAPVPLGANAVLPVEHTETLDNQLEAQGEVSPGKNVGKIGEDIRKGEVVLAQGRRLRPQDVGVLSSIGCTAVEVFKRPRVQIIVTGNELVAAGTVPGGYQIADANGPMLAALVERDGGIPLLAGIVPDEPEAILAALGADAEVVLVSGGSSVGQEDYVPKLLAERGELAIHGIAMRPSSPTGMGKLDEKLVFLLPGNPVSCLSAYDFFAGRAIRQFGGRCADWPYRRLRAPLCGKLVSQIGRLDYARVSVRDEGVQPLGIGGASVLSSTTRADGFVVVPTDSEGFPPGALVDVFLYE